MPGTHRFGSIFAASRRRRLLAMRDYHCGPSLDAKRIDSESHGVASTSVEQPSPSTHTNVADASPVAALHSEAAWDAPREQLQRRLADSHSLSWVVAGDGFDAAPDEAREWRNFAGRLAEAIRRIPARSDDVLAISTRPGQTIARLADELTARVLRLHPDVVLLSLGPGDWEAGLRGLRDFENGLAQVVERILAARAIPVLSTPPLYPDAAGPEAVDRYVYVAAIRAIAAEYDLPLVDHWAHWESTAESSGGTGHWFDGETLQPGRIGHEQLTQRIVVELELSARVRAG